MGASRAIALCQCFNGALEYQIGHWQDAEDALREAIQLDHEIGAAAGEALACQRLGRLQTARGQLDEAMQTLETGVAAAEHALMRAHCLARLYATMTHNRLLADDLSAANDLLSLGLTMSQRHGHCSTCDSLLLPVAVSVRIAQGDLPAAEEFCHQLHESAARYGSATWIAMARQAHGELAAARGEVDSALASYRAAQASFQASGFVYEAARCLLQIARLHETRQKADDAEQAGIARQEAERILQQLRAS